MAAVRCGAIESRHVDRLLSAHVSPTAGRIPSNDGPLSLLESLRPRPCGGTMTEIRTRLSGPVVDTDDDAIGLAHFYATLLGWRVAD